MKHLIFGAIVALVASVGMAGEYISPVTGRPVPKDGKLTLEQVKERDERVLRKTGGFVEVPAKGASVAILDARTKHGGAAVQFKDVFENLSRTVVKVAYEKIEGKAADEAAIAFRNKTKACFALAVVEESGLRGMTVLPEERVAIVNAAKLVDASDPVKSEVRVHKELWRAIGFVAGIGYAPYENDVLQPVFSVHELDALTYQVMQPMNFQKMYSVLSKFGVTRARRIPYRVAVQEGWAAQPTNDYQRAVWNKVHAIPDKPLTIEFDPKKDK